MKVILIEGVANSGKTTLCNDIRSFLEKTCSAQIEIEDIDKKNKKDFVGIYLVEGKRIFINSWSDMKSVIDYFDYHYQTNKKQGYDILITAIRPKETNPKLHQWVKNVYGQDINSNKDELVIDLDSVPRVKRLENLFIPLYQSII